MQFSLLSIVYLIAFSHALLVAVVLMKKSQKNQPGILLAIMVLFFGYKLLEGGIQYSELYKALPHLLDWLPGVVLFMGPIFYAYVCRMSGDKVWSIKQWFLHLLPAFIMACWFSPQLFVSAALKIQSIEYYQARQGPSQIPLIYILLLVSWKIHLATYLGLAWKKLIQIESHSIQQFSDDSVFAIGWQKRLCLMLMALELLWIVLFVSEQMLGLVALDYVSKVWLLFMASIILVMGYWGLQHPDLVVQPIKDTDNSKLIEAENVQPINSQQELNENKKSASLVDEVTAKSIAKEIEQQMVEHQLYLKLGLKLTELSSSLGLRNHIVSEVINQTMQTSFFHLINGYRVAHAKQLLQDPNQFRTLEQISIESGFNNRVTFNKAFKTEEGMTPSEYRKT